MLVGLQPLSRLCVRVCVTLLSQRRLTRTQRDKTRVFFGRSSESRKLCCHKWPFSSRGLVISLPASHKKTLSHFALLRFLTSHRSRTTNLRFSCQNIKVDHLRRFIDVFFFFFQPFQFLPRFYFPLQPEERIDSMRMVPNVKYTQLLMSVLQLTVTFY